MSEVDLIQITKEHYDNKKQDDFYYQIWGGEDIHIGIYDKPTQTVKKASHNTTLKMLKLLPSFKKSTKFLDLGSGFGGAARFLAEKYNCKIDCLNLSDLENKRNEKRVKADELEKYVTITAGSYKQIPFDLESFDLIWSQDAFYHCNDKLKVFREIAQVLKPGGRFIFTDIMQSDDCPENALKEILTDLNLDELASVKSYQLLARKADLEKVYLREMPDQLVNHFSNILKLVEEDQTKLNKKFGEAFIKKRKKEIEQWIDAGSKGYLNWGILQFQKRNM